MTEDRVSLQELFDSQAFFTPKEVGVLFDTLKVWEKYTDEFVQERFSLEYHKDIQAVADKYDLDYDMPKRMGNLTPVEGVGSTTTLH